MENSSTSFKERFGPKFPRPNVLRLADTFGVVSRSSILYQRFLTSKGRTIRKLMGGAGEVQKKNSRKGKLNEKKFLQAN